MPGRQPGFYPKSQLNHLDESSILYQQLPFIIGLTFAVPVPTLDTLMSQCFTDAFILKFRRGVYNKRITFRRLVKKLAKETKPSQLLKLAKKINKLKLDDFTLLEQVEIIHLGKNELPASKLEPNHQTIQGMVKRFMERLYIYGKITKVLKQLLLGDITAVLNKIVCSIDNSNPNPGSARNSLFKLTLRQMTRFTQETFVLSFNGSRYDLPLIIDYIYRYTIKSKQCKVRTFRKGSVYTSIAANWRASGKTWAIQISLKDVRNLTEQNCSLGLLSQRFGVPPDNGKGTFPHSANSSVRFNFKHIIQRASVISVLK